MDINFSWSPSDLGKIILSHLNLIIYNYCTWTRSIWGLMEQNTTILNEAKLHKTSYWSSSSVVIVLLHKALFYSNFESFFEILWIFWKFFFNSIILIFFFLIYCAIKNNIALSCHVISFIDFARECNMIFYCT